MDGSSAGRGLLVIRADASTRAGGGHVHRCLALAERWLLAGGTAILAAADLPDSLARRAVDRGVEVLAIGATAAALSSLVHDRSPAWVTVDGYHLTAEHQRAAAAAGARVLVVDDHGHVGTYDADVVLDQNLGAEPGAYRGAAVRSILLLGPRYALVRPAFEAPTVRRWDARRVLITLGAFGHVAGDTLAEAIRSRTDAEVTVATGDIDDMPAAMAASDLAVSAAGSTCWELCASGLPMLLTTVAANQEPLARGLHAAGAAVDLGSIATLDPAIVGAHVADLFDRPDRLAAMSETGRRLVDGRGATRVMAAMDACEMTLRQATNADAELLWRWANDPTVRAVSLSSEPIPWERHVEWLDERLHSGRSWIFVGERDGEAVGQVRFDLVDDGSAEIGLSVDERQRGRGLAPTLLAQATARLYAVANVDRVIGLVRTDNHASAAAFRSAGFREDGTEARGDILLRRFVLVRGDG